MYVLCRESPIVHEEKVDVSGIMDDESFVAGGHQMPGFLIGTISNLSHGTSISLSPQK